MTSTLEPAETVRPARSRPRLLTVLGVVLLLAGFSCLGWVAYQYVGTNVVSRHAFEQEKSGLRTQWQRGGDAGTASGARRPSPGGTALPGDAIALLRVPRFGADYEVPILEGTDLSVLSHGVGHYPGTAGAGQIGNFALAGHRVTYGEPFSRLLELDPGDQVIVETRTAIYTYVLDTAPRDLTVRDTASWVLQPVPGKPEQAARQALITLTTCSELFHTPNRSVGFGHLARTTDKY